MPGPATVSDKKRNDPLPESEHAALRASLARLGLTGAQVQQAVGAAASGRTRVQIAQALCSWLRTRPKG